MFQPPTSIVLGSVIPLRFLPVRYFSIWPCARPRLRLSCVPRVLFSSSFPLDAFPLYSGTRVVVIYAPPTFHLSGAIGANAQYLYMHLFGPKMI